MADQIPEDEIIINNKSEKVVKFKLKCEYANCSKDAEMSVEVKLSNEKDAAVKLPFCKYHGHIVLGGFFSAEHKDKLFHMSGPIKEIQLIEQVIGAIEVTKKKE